MSDLKDDILDDLSSMDIGVKERHGCVTVWLVFIIIVYVLLSMTHRLTTTDLGTGLGTPDVEGPLIWVLMGISLANAFFAYLILSWKKIGFMGFAVTASIVFCVNLYYGLGLYESIGGFLGIGVLFAILQIKNRHGKTAWELLE